MRATIFILLFFLTFSCKEKETTYKVSLINNSSHKVELNSFYFQYIGGGHVILNQSQIISFQKSERGEGDWLLPEQLVLLDSIMVTYNDTLTVYHGHKAYNVNRNLKNMNFYNKYKEDDKPFTRYNYEYTFTNADFDEAKTINGL